MAHHYTVVYEGHPGEARILNGEAAPGQACGVSLGDVFAERDQLQAALAAALARAEAAEARIAAPCEALRIVINVHSTEQNSCRLEIPKGMAFGEAVARVQAAQTAIAAELERQARCPASRALRILSGDPS